MNVSPAERVPRVEAKPWLDRQIDGVPWLWWRQVADGRREGLVAGPFWACAERACPCAEVEVALCAVQDDLQEAELSNGHLRLYFPLDHRATPGRRPDARVTVDFETGAIAKRNGDGGLIAWFEAGIDGDLLDALWRRWSIVRGLRPGGGTRPRLEPGVMVAHSEVFAGRNDAFLVDGERYEARDFHCPMPACGCGESLVAFATSWSRGDLPVGGVTIGLADGEARTFRAERDDANPLLQRLYAAYAARHPDRDRLRRRRAEVLDAPPAPVSEPARRESERVGRNDPCPCGSGKKHKKCCGA